jgi:hypothetical protein
MPIIFLFVLWLILGITQAVFYNSDIVESLLMNALIIIVGIGGLFSFIEHFFFPGRIAASTGWPSGNPFQSEVAMANLALGVLGILSYWIRYYFWIATVIAFSIFMLGAAYVHIREMRKAGNFSINNAVPMFIGNVGIPLILIGVLVIYILRSPVYQ